MSLDAKSSELFYEARDPLVKLRIGKLLTRGRLQCACIAALGRLIPKQLGNSLKSIRYGGHAEGSVGSQIGAKSFGFFIIGILDAGQPGS